MYVHHVHPIVWGFFSRYKQSFLPAFVYVSACQRSASDCLCTLLLLLPHPVYRSATASIASPLLSRTSHSTSGCFSHFNLCRLSGAKCLLFELVMQAAFASIKQLLFRGRPKPFQLFLARKWWWVLFAVPSFAKTIDRQTAGGWKISCILSVPSTWSLRVDSILSSRWTWREKNCTS